jgi:hypothetical protein
MSLELIPLSVERAAEIREKHFNIHPNINTYVHEGRANGELLGYVCTEDFGLVQGPHIYVLPEHHNRESLTKVTHIFKGLYIPMMRDAGCISLATNCDQEDTGTTNFLQTVGFEIKHVTVAEMTL